VKFRDRKKKIAGYAPANGKEVRPPSLKKEQQESGEDEQKEGENEIPRALLAYPTHNPLVDWEQDEKGLVTLIYRKNLGKFELWLQSKIGGPMDIRRPLVGPGSRIWELSDGEHNILDICKLIDEEFKEEISPVFSKVRRFLEELLFLNLIILKSPEEIEKEREMKKELKEKEGMVKREIVREGL